MSDLESSNARAVTASPASQVALGKLRAMGGRGLAASNEQGVFDAFAEVFAQIAASRPVEAPKSESNVEVTGESSGSHDDAPQRQGENRAETDASHRSDVIKPTLVRDESALVEVSDEQPEIADQEITLEIPSDSSDEEVEIQVVQSDDQQELTQSSDAIPVPVETLVVAGEQEGRRHRKQQSNVELEPLVGRHQKTATEDVHQVESNLATAATDGSDLSGDELVNSTGWAGEDQGTRRLRRRGYRQGGIEVPSNATSNPKQMPPELRAQVASAMEAAADTTLGPARPGESAANHQPNQRATAAVTHLQTVSSAARSGSPSPAASGAQSARADVQPVDGQRAASNAAHAKKFRPQVKNPTAETVSRVKLIQRVSKAFQHLGPEGGVVRLRLAPAELGSVRVEMRIQQRKVQARVVAETEAASSALREHLPDLRQRLESQGLQIESLEIQQEQDGADLDGRFSHHGGEHSQRRSQRGNRPHNASREQTIANATEAVSRPISNDPWADSVSGGIDVRL